MESQPPAHHPDMVSIARTVGRLNDSLERIRRRVDELHQTERRLDRALAYSLDPGANQALARAYYHCVLKHRDDVVTRLRAEREEAQQVMLSTERLMVAGRGQGATSLAYGE
jgi:hypothetical protein